MKRFKLWLSPFLRGAAALAVLLLAPAAMAQQSVKVGVLHSLTGTMAISEAARRDVVLMAVAETNSSAGLKGGGKAYMIEPVVVDPASNWPLFAEKAKQL